jgi:hypothetical protein
MDFHEIDCQGDIWVERVAGVPGWVAADEGRVIYDTVTNAFYYGSNAAWIYVGPASTTLEGLAEMATDAEAAAGLDQTRYINPKQLQDNISTAIAASGKIGQVVYDSATPPNVYNGPGWHNTPLSLNITPSDATSRILISATLQGEFVIHDSDYVGFDIRQQIGAVNTYPFRGTSGVLTNFTQKISSIYQNSFAFSGVVSPSTTNTINYLVRLYVPSGTSFRINQISGDGVRSTLIAMEILA